MTTTEIRPEDYAPLKRAADAGRVRLLDLGVGFDADALWFNLQPGRVDPGRAAWLQHEALRRAIAMAVDRTTFVNTVFLGAGVPVYGPLTPTNTRWFAELPPIRHDPAGAGRLLDGIGLVDRNGDGMREDAGGRPARFTLLVQKGNTAAERGASVIREALAPLGLGVDVVALDANAVIARVLSGNYEAVLYRLTATDTDPAANLDFWMSSGSAHVWNPEQRTPATEWEARIDGLMRRQARAEDADERRRVFAEVQRIFAEHLPMLHFAAPRVYVALSTRIVEASPTAFSRPQLLWAPDTLAVAQR